MGRRGLPSTALLRQLGWVCAVGANLHLDINYIRSDFVRKL